MYFTDSLYIVDLFCLFSKFSTNDKTNLCPNNSCYGFYSSFKISVEESFIKF